MQTVRIVIEIGGAETSVTTSLGDVGAAVSPGMPGAPGGATPPPPAVAAAAAATGALNAGAAPAVGPAMAGMPSAPAPLMGEGAFMGADGGQPADQSAGPSPDELVEPSPATIEESPEDQ